ncbi:MAG: MFS transporter [Chlamydiia bacterium]|nr:MFS transporter [Chlamydiia bacterium]
MACIKPASSLLAFRVSSYIVSNPKKLTPFLVVNALLGALPCFLIPFIDNPWFYVAYYALFLTTIRAVNPAWIEYLKRHVDADQLRTTISRGVSMYYALGIIVPPLICFSLDFYPELWRLYFIGFALLQLLNLKVIFSVTPPESYEALQKPKLKLKEIATLFKKTPGFFPYQLLFFLGGMGIVASQSTLPGYFQDHLHLSYTQLGLAFSFCKGLTFVLSSPFWTKSAGQISIYRINAYLNIFSCLYFGLLIGASLAPNWIFPAYLFYGVMQAGAQISWNLSGPYFSQEKDSTPYSSINLLFTGIRGCLCPLLGMIVYGFTGVFSLYVFCGTLCLLGVIYGFWLDHFKVYKSTPSVST